MNDELKTELTRQNRLIDEVNIVKAKLDRIIDETNGGHKKLIIAIMAFENNENLSNNNILKYEKAYYHYLEEDDITLLSQEIIDKLNEENNDKH